MTQTITRHALQAKLDGQPGVTLVEALPDKYFRHSHLPGALNIPHDRIDALAPELLPDRGAEIVVYCANAACQNSRIAAQRLGELGYTKVSVYEAGKADWIEAGLPVEGTAAQRVA